MSDHPPFPTFYVPADPAHVRRERQKARDLRAGSWWKQQLGRGICYHCGQKFDKVLLTMDHLIPIARGGKSTKNNCVVSCKDCNSEKGAELTVEKAFRELQAAQSTSSEMSEENEDRDDDPQD